MVRRDILMKKCSICKEIKSLSCFHKDKSRKDGLSYRCTDCGNKLNKDSYYRNLKKRLETYKKHDRSTGLMQKYGITPDEWDAMYVKQGGRCLICGKHQSETKEDRRLCVDHDHKTGKVRGLLCLSCNTKLGWMETNLKNIINYLGE